MKKIRIVMGVVLFILLFWGTPAQASDSSFSVKPLISETDRIENGDYFVLKSRRGQSEKREIELINYSDQKLKVAMNVVNATTNDNGIATYNVVRKADTSAKVTLEQLVTTPKKIELAPKQKKVVTFTVQYPQVQFEGVVAGALNFYSEFTETKDKSGAISSRYGYTIAILINDQKLTQWQQPRLVKTGVKLINNKPNFLVQLQNRNPAYLNKMQVAAEFVNLDDESIKYQKCKADLQFSPNSVYNHLLDLTGRKIVPGLYRLTVKIESKQGNWLLKQKVKVTKEGATLLNETDLAALTNKKEYQQKMIILAAIASCILAMAYSVYRRLVKRRKNEEEN